MTDSISAATLTCLLLFLISLILLLLSLGYNYRQERRHKQQLTEMREQMQIQMQQVLDRQRQEVARIETKTSADTFLAHLDRYIETNLKGGNITAEMVCREMSMSETPLRSKLRELTGLSLNAYVMEFRMSRASRLIETSDLSLAEVALECGYNSFSYFSQAFKRYYNILPSQYTRKAEETSKNRGDHNQ